MQHNPHTPRKKVCGHVVQVTLYDTQGGMLQQLDFSNSADARDFTSAAFNPGGDVVVLGGYDCLTTCTFNAQAGVWEIAGTKKVMLFVTGKRTCTRVISLAQLGMFQGVMLSIVMFRVV